MAAQHPNSWGSNYRSIYERNQILLNNQELSDVKFQFEDNTILFAHKFILASRSPVFEKMFVYWNADEGIIQMGCITANIFFKFLQYLYTDDISWLRVYNVGPVMAIAHKYGVNHLENLCYDYMSGRLSIENACTFLEHCYLFSNKFTEKLFSLIDSRCEDIILQQSFADLCIDALVCIVKRNTLVVRETHLFKQLLDCTYLACKNTKPHSDARIVFDQIRFPAMNIAEFSECLRIAPNFFTEDEKVCIVNYIHASNGSLQTNKCNVTYPSMKREWKLIKEFHFGTQTYECREGNKTFSMRFQVSKPIEIKEIEAYANDNCSYFVELSDGLYRPIFSRFIPQADSYTVAVSFRLEPRKIYTWKTNLYCTWLARLNVSQGNNKIQLTNTFLFLGKGRSVVKKIKFIEK